MRISRTLTGVGAAALILAAAFGGAIAQSRAEQVQGIFHSFSPPPAAGSAVEAGTANPSMGENYQLGSKAFGSGDFSAARQYWQKGADEGDLFALWRLANMYRLGQGVEKDPGTAFGLYAKVAAEHSDSGYMDAHTRITVDAMVRLADYYRTGIAAANIKARPERAFRMYQMAATHYGHPDAQFALGQMFCKGEGVTKSTSRCIRWYMLAARKRHVRAQASLGELFWQGEGVQQDKVRALMWFALAQLNASSELQKLVVERYAALYAKANEDERHKAEELVSVWTRKYGAVLATQ